MTIGRCDSSYVLAGWGFECRGYDSEYLSAACVFDQQIDRTFRPDPQVSDSPDATDEPLLLDRHIPIERNSIQFGGLERPDDEVASPSWKHRAVVDCET